MSLACLLPRYLLSINEAAAAKLPIIVLVEASLLKLHRLGAGPLGVVGALEATGWLLQDFLHVTLLGWLGFGHSCYILVLLRNLLDVLIDGSGSPVGEQRTVIQVVVVFFTEAGIQPTSLVKEPLIKHGLSGRWLSLAECDLLRYVTLVVALGFQVFLSSYLHATVTLDFPLPLVPE